METRSACRCCSDSRFKFGFVKYTIRRLPVGVGMTAEEWKMVCKMGGCELVAGHSSLPCADCVDLSAVPAIHRLAYENFFYENF
jgi:hypothetical protein